MDHGRAEILLSWGVRVRETLGAKRRGRLENRFQTIGTWELSVQITRSLLHSQIIFAINLFPLRFLYSSSWGQVMARVAERQQLQGCQKKRKVQWPLAFSWGLDHAGNEMSLAASAPNSCECSKSSPVSPVHRTLFQFIIMSFTAQMQMVKGFSAQRALAF